MAVDIKEVLKLPQRERRKISERMVKSHSQNYSMSELSKDEKRVLKNRWINIYLVNPIAIG